MLDKLFGDDRRAHGRQAGDKFARSRGFNERKQNFALTDRR